MTTETHKLKAKEEFINQLIQEVYEEAEGQWIPRFPWVLVRVLPRHQTTASGLVLPDHEQNKTIHEGIVIRTWEPIKVGPTDLKPKEVNGVPVRKHPLKHVASGEGVLYESELKEGDHVLFPHWAGLPVPFMKDTRYRMVKEEEWSSGTEGGIFATIQNAAPTLPTPDEAAAMQVLYERFILIPRDAQSQTMSGK